jgi:hypothetical protein
MKVDMDNTAGALIQQLTKKFNFSADELAIFIPPPPSAPPEKPGIWIPREQKLGSIGLKEGVSLFPSSPPPFLSRRMPSSPFPPSLARFSTSSLFFS